MKKAISVIIIFCLSTLSCASLAEEVVNSFEKNSSISALTYAERSEKNDNGNLYQEKKGYEKIISDQNEVINKLISSLQIKKIEKVETDYSGWVSILLGCVGIIITVVSVVVAIVSVVGYRNFQKKIENVVKTISSEVALEQTTSQLDIIAKKEIARLLDEGLLNKHLQDAVNVVFLRKDDSLINNGFNKYPELDLEEENLS